MAPTPDLSGFATVGKLGPLPDLSGFATVGHLLPRRAAPLPSEPTMADVASDLAEAIHHGLFHPQEQLPSQRCLGAAYGLSPASAQRALGQLGRHGLADLRNGRGAYVVERPHTTAVLRLWRAASVCSHLVHHAQPALFLNEPGDLATLSALSPAVLHWMARQFAAAARQLLVTNRCDPEAMVSAADVLRSGAARAHHLAAAEPGALVAGRLAELAERLRPSR